MRVPAVLGLGDEQDRYSPSLQERAAWAQGRHTADGCPKSGGTATVGTIEGGGAGHWPGACGNLQGRSG